MKKYKLIKLFPNSLSLGQVITEMDDCYVDEYQAYTYSKEDVEQMPEFWEEVKSEEKILIEEVYQLLVSKEIEHYSAGVKLKTWLDGMQ